MNWSGLKSFQKNFFSEKQELEEKSDWS